MVSIERGIKKYARVVVAAVIAYYTAGAVNTWMIGPICVPVGSYFLIPLQRPRHALATALKGFHR
jgi:hypothetical protein